MPKGTKPPAHPLAALMSIGGMSLVLAAVVAMLGLSSRLDFLLTAGVKATGLGGDFRILPGYVPWLWTVPAVIGLTAAMLATRFQWRRSVLWVAILVLTVAWIPVLALAGYASAVATPLLALIWSGLWATIYATRHQEPGES